MTTIANRIPSDVAQSKMTVRKNLENVQYLFTFPPTDSTSVKAAWLLMQQKRGNFSAKGREVATRSISSAMENVSGSQR